MCVLRPGGVVEGLDDDGTRGWRVRVLTLIMFRQRVSGVCRCVRCHETMLSDFLAPADEEEEEEECGVSECLT